MKKVDHAKLLEKMKNKFGIQGRLGILINKFLENRVQEKSMVKSGSFQGSVLGPVLFLMFIQDISEDMTVNTKDFVDDTKLKEKIIDEDDVVKVHENLDKLYKWQNINNMKFDGPKFQVLRYGPNEEVKNDTVYSTDNMENVIHIFSSVRDLRMILSDDV